jgi:hypothetical protein
LAGKIEVLKVFLLRTKRPISVQLVINHPRVKVTQVSSNKGPVPLQREW